MRTAYAMLVLALVACQESYPQKPVTNPEPQQPVTHPSPQPRGPDFQIEQPPALNDPAPQQSVMQTPESTPPMESAGPQKPFYGPGLKSPDEQEQARAKAKAPLANDGEVIAFLIAVNDGEVQMAEVAKKASSAADVKNFAAMMSTHHQAGLAKVRKVQADTKIESKDNDLTGQVKADANHEMALIRDKKGKDFDLVYMQTQVRLHKGALDALDNRVIPAISNGELKTATTEMRRQVADHLAKAEEISKKLDSQTATTTSH